MTNTRAHSALDGQNIHSSPTVPLKVSHSDRERNVGADSDVDRTI